MPIFDFKCEHCGYKAEVIDKRSRVDHVRPCPNCEDTSYKRIASTKAPHITFRGHGWTGRIK